ncbi:MAG: tetratricopeptide repeat protein [Crocinitomicaceae bacterium]|nr:tetratricopeptide repeat protein [Crocinitomicaceae bacterium]
MPRLYLIYFLLLATPLSAQKQLQRLIAHADTQVQALDYIEALRYYAQALELEPNNIDLHWKIAQANQQFKDYKTAASYFLKVFEQDPDGQKYPEAQLNYGLMLKQQGRYKDALAQLKEAKRFFAEDKKNQFYLKAEQEIIACNWVLKQLKFVSAEENSALLQHPVNTVDTEFGHLFLNDTLIFSSLRADSTAADEEQVFSAQYTIQLYQFPASTKNQVFITGLRPQEEYGNFTLAPDSSFALCSACQREATNLKCRIMKVLKQDGKWYLDTNAMLSLPAATYQSMPHLFELNGQLKLIYAATSARENGDLDLWLTTFAQDGTPQNPTNLSGLNSLENEVSPWFDPLFKRLYFSSTWHAGFGGYDIFYAALQTDGSFGPPVNLGLPFNSSANELYFFCQSDTAYLSSNRIGSLYASHPTCCSDIFYQYFPRPKSPKEVVETTAIQIVNLPIRLYFENDHPNPKTTADFTDLSYEETYVKYKSQYPLYLQKVTEGRDSLAAIQQAQSLLSFFETEVDHGMQDLALFREQVWQALLSGQQVSIMVQGFASPLAKSDYNVHLTNRRISAIKNYFEEIDGSKFAPYMLSSPIRLQFIEVPMGEYKANKDVSDNYYDQRNSVYSKDASLERRIEIIELRTESLPPR